MNNIDKTKEELIKELQELQQEHNFLKLSYDKEIAGFRKTVALLQENFAKLQVTIDEAPVCVAMVGLDKHFLYCNKVFCHWIGHTEEEMKGKTIADITFAEDVKIGMDDLRAILTGEKESSHVPKRYVCKDGRVVWGDVNIRLIRTPDGKPLYFLPIIQDITERKQAEEKIKESEELFKHVFESSNVGKSITLPTGEINVNQAFCNMLGYSGEELKNKKWQDLTPRDEVPAIMEIITSLLTGEKSEARFKKNYVHKNGTRIYADVSVALLRDQQGKPLHFITTIVDISEQKQAEEALKSSEERYALVIDASEQGIWDWNVETNEVFFSEQWKKQIGYNDHELKNDFNTWIEHLHPDEREYCQNAVSAYLNQPVEHFFLEFRFRHKDGTYRWIHNKASSLKNDEGKVIRMFGTHKDITERKIADAKILEINKQLTELNATKDKFFNIIAHDLKSPFNSIVGFSELLVDMARDKDYDEMGKYAGIIHQSAHRAIDLLVNLMEWARSQTGRIEFNPEIFEMDELINNVVELLSDNAAQKSIKISKTMPSKGIAKADKAMISTVLRNLIANSIKFTKPGGEIILSVTENNSEITVAVRDNGIGIPAHLTAKLFRLDESFTTRGTEKEQGTGLGLILCKEFVEKNGGKIWVESTENKGTVFTFTVPGNQRF